MARGLVAATVTHEEGVAGLVAQYSGPGEYLRFELDLASSRASVVRFAGGSRQVERGASVPFRQNGRHRLVGVFDASGADLFVDGERLLHLPSPGPVEGRVGLLAGRGAQAEFDDVGFSSVDDAAPRVDPFSPGRAAVGAPYGITLGCLNGACEFRARPADLPPGLALQRDGRLSGRPRRPGTYRFDVTARLKDTGATAQVRLTLGIDAVSWPRFPVDVASRSIPRLAVLYTPDDIGSTVSLDKLGRPDRLLYRLHRDHPLIKVTVMACPANRYLGGAGPVTGAPEAAAAWRALALDPALDWIDLGGHGYTHSPDGDENLNHHEFSTMQTGCNVDHSRLGSARYCRRQIALSRGAFRALGLAEDLVAVMRFPGVVDSPEALKAAGEAGFLAILGSRHLSEAGREWWVPHPGGEILEIENSGLTHCFSRSKSLETALGQGALTAASLATDRRFLDEVKRGRDYVDLVATQGGILNLFDHYWETFQAFGGVPSRYLVLDAVLSDIESRYAGMVWYPSARDLAVWLDVRRHAGVEWREIDQGLLLALRPPPAWKQFRLSGLGRATLIARLPVGFTGVSQVDIKTDGGAFEPLAPSRWWLGPDGIVVNFPFQGGLQLLIKPEELPGHEQE